MNEWIVPRGVQAGVGRAARGRHAFHVRRPRAARRLDAVGDVDRRRQAAVAVGREERVAGRHRHVVRQARMRYAKGVRRQPILLGKAVDVRRGGISDDALVFLVLHHDDEHMVEARDLRAAHPRIGERHTENEKEYAELHAAEPFGVSEKRVRGGNRIRAARIRSASGQSF